MKRLFAIALGLACAPLTQAEHLFQQDFDAFPDALEGPYRPPNAADAGTWYGFGVPGNHTTLQSERARGGKALRLVRGEEDTVSQSVQCYVRPTSAPRLSFKFSLYIEGDGGIRISMDRHTNRLFAVSIGTRQVQVFNPETTEWRTIEAPAIAKNTWMEWTIDCDRTQNTYELRLRHEDEPGQTVVATGLPLNSAAEAEQQIFEINADPGGPYFIDDLSLEEGVESSSSPLQEG